MTTRKQRLGAIAATLATAAVAGTGVAIAAGLNTNGGGIGTGSVTADCQTGAITPSWVFTYDSTIPGYRITGVTLTGINSGCLNKNVKVVMATAAGVSSVVGSGTTPGAGSTATITLTTGHNMASTWLGQLVVVVYE